MLVSVNATADTDGDGLMDSCDNCVDVANNGGDGTPAQCDTDGDDIGNACDGDFNNNGVINFPDLAMMKSAIFSSPGDSNWNADADMTCNGVVNFPDLARIKSMFFQAPGPSGSAAITLRSATSREGRLAPALPVLFQTQSVHPYGSISHLWT